MWEDVHVCELSNLSFCEANKLLPQATPSEKKNEEEEEEESSLCILRRTNLMLMFIFLT